MSYNVDTIDWQAIRDIDEWLDNGVSADYHNQPLAQHWARVCKDMEETGESVAELILLTGQNPRKGIDPTAYERLLNELADRAFTSILAIQHFTKDIWVTRQVLMEKLIAMEQRVPQMPMPIGPELPL